MPTVVNQITIGDVIQVFAVLVACVGLFLNWSQLKSANRQKRAEYIIDLYNQSALDKDVLDIYYQIEYGKFTYEPKKFHGSPEEIKLDKLIEIYDNIGILYLLGNFKLADLSYVAYSYLVVYQDESVQRYLMVLDSWYRRRGMKIKPFMSFRSVGEVLERKYFDKKQIVPEPEP